MQRKTIDLMKKLKKIRKSLGITQYEIGQIVGVNQSQWSKYERCEQSISICQLYQLAGWMGITIGDLIEVTPEQMQITAFSKKPSGNREKSVRP